MAYLLEIVFHQIFLENNFILWQAKLRKLGDCFLTHLRLLPNIKK